jgi:hypothetical protein
LVVGIRGQPPTAAAFHGPTPDSQFPTPNRLQFQNVPAPPISNTILDTIGNTPLVRINAITRGVTEADVLAKIETFNPGNSIKDRMAVTMIEDAERSGALQPGGRLSKARPATPAWAWRLRRSSRATAASSRPPTSSRRRRSTR